MAVSKTLRFQILRRDNYTCRTCGRSAPEVKLHVDHVVPEALGGRSEASNLQTLCADCNGGKSATPPDAAQVEQVSADAIRWADAQRVVVARMMAEIKSRTRIYNKVDKLWKEYGNVYRPADWKRSVDQFLDAGLPPEMVLRAAETALGKQTVRADSCFKYMCGIAWSRIAEIREATGTAVGPPPVATPQPGQTYSHADRDVWEMTGWNQGRTELAAEILDHLDAVERQAMLADGREAAICEGDELDGSEPADSPYLLGRGAIAAFQQFRIRAKRMENLAEEALNSLGSDVLADLALTAGRQLDAANPEGYAAEEATWWVFYHLVDRLKRHQVRIVPAEVMAGV